MNKPASPARSMPPEERTGTSPDGGPAFLARGIEKSFTDVGRTVEVLKGVDLELHRGRMLAVVGASGTGKTTLLHILGTLDRPDRGRLIYQGRDVLAMNDIQLSAFRNRTVGFVFQFHHLLPEFTALENVMMPGLIAGYDRGQLQAEAADILALVRLEQRTDHKVGELSGGEQQRVALARAVVMKPLLLLADEPTGNLDTRTGHRVFELLREMSDTYSLSTVMVTHNLELAREMDACLTLHEGRLREGLQA